MFYHQFVCVESLATAISDLFPVELRSKKKGRQEILVLVIATVCFLLALPFITQVERERESERERERESERESTILKDKGYWTTILIK